MINKCPIRRNFHRYRARQCELWMSGHWICGDCEDTNFRTTTCRPSTCGRLVEFSFDAVSSSSHSTNGLSSSIPGGSPTMRRRGRRWRRNGRIAFYPTHSGSAKSLSDEWTKHTRVFERHTPNPTGYSRTLLSKSTMLIINSPAINLRGLASMDYRRGLIHQWNREKHSSSGETKKQKIENEKYWWALIETRIEIKETHAKFHANSRPNQLCWLQTHRL